MLLAGAYQAGGEGDNRSEGYAQVRGGSDFPGTARKPKPQRSTRADSPGNGLASATYIVCTGRKRSLRALAAGLVWNETKALASIWEGRPE